MTSSNFLFVNQQSNALSYSINYHNETKRKRKSCIQLLLKLCHIGMAVSEVVFCGVLYRQWQNTINTLQNSIKQSNTVTRWATDSQITGDETSPRWNKGSIYCRAVLMDRIVSCRYLHSVDVSTLCWLNESSGRVAFLRCYIHVSLSKYN